MITIEIFGLEGCDTCEELKEALSDISGATIRMNNVQHDLEARVEMAWHDLPETPAILVKIGGIVVFREYAIEDVEKTVGIIRVNLSEKK